MANRRSEARKERRRAGSTTRDSKHRAGGDWTTLRIPDGLQLFQPKEGTYRMDIVPYEVGEGNPYASKGEWYYERTYFIHSRIGPNNESYVCPNKTAKQPCPICEHRASLLRETDGDEKLIKDLKPKERQLFLVHIIGDDDGSPVRLYESSFHTFGKLLDKRRQDAEEDEPHISHFDDHEAGSTLKVAYQDTDAGGYNFVECYGIDFKQRTKGLDEELLDHGFCLDDMVVILGYEELKKKFYQEPEAEEDDDEPVRSKPTKKSPNPAAVEEDGDGDDGGDDASGDNPAEEMGLEVGMTVRHRTEGVCTILRISGDGTSLVLENEEGEKVRAVAPSEVKVVPAKKEEKAPAKPQKETKPAKPAKSVKPPADEEEDGWEEDKPPTKKAKKAPVKASKSDDDDGDGEEEDDWY